MINELWKSYKRYIRISKKESIFAISFGILGAFFETIAIYLLANLITGIENKNVIINSNLIKINLLNKEFAIIFFISTALFSAILYFFSNKNIIKAKCKIERFVRQEITDITLKIKWEYYLKLSQGDISKSIISEGQNISEGYMYFISSITYISIAIAYFIICLVLVPDTFLILIIYAIFAFRIYIYYSNKAQIHGKDLSEITSNIGNWTSSIFNNLKYIKTISKDNLAKEEANKIFYKFSESYSKAMIASYKSKLITEILTIIFIFLAILYIIINQSSKSDLILSLSLFVRMTPKVYSAQSRLLDSVAMISWPKLHHAKINWSKSHINYSKNKRDSSLFKYKGDIILKSISFKYPENQPILENLNLSIKDKESIGIIGDSGSGKSTLIDLITGIVQPTKGEIYVSGSNINSIDIESWRSKIGIVMQDNFFKNESIVANVALGDKNINNRKLVNSLKQSNSWIFVKNLPNGINEIMFDGGMRFSGGQRKKLALARALYSSPEVLILDEPSTGLDEKSELEFMKTIKKLLGKMTIVIVSHKKEIVQMCDRVLIVEGKKLKNI